MVAFYLSVIFTWLNVDKILKYLKEVDMKKLSFSFLSMAIMILSLISGIFMINDNKMRGGTCRV